VTPKVSRGNLIMACFDDIQIGDRFEFLEVIGKEKPSIILKCVCKKEIKILPRAWQKQKSCRCMKGLLTGLSVAIHGHSRHIQGAQVITPTYMTWRSMKARCYNKNSDRYPYYGGRGIVMCDDWKKDFEIFLKDMGERPMGTSIDRIDVNGNYCPENCRWATKAEQARNTRFTRYLELNGERKCIKTWAEDLGIKIKTLENRIYLGWSDEKALLTPVKTRK
jgi:hypothetical protein